MRKNRLILAGLVTAASTMTAAHAAAPATWENSDLHKVSVIMSEPMMKVDGGYHELIDGLYLKPRMTEEKIVLAPLRDMLDELNGDMKFDGKAVTYRLNDKIVSMTIGSREATVNGKKAEAPAKPALIDDALYVPFRFVFEGLGGKYRWNSKREMAEITLLRPKGSMFKAKKGKVTRKTILKQEPDWYGSEAAMKVAKGIIGNQNEDGGWFKLGGSDDMAQIVDRDTFATYRQKSTIDNNATSYQLIALSRIYAKTQDNALKDSMIKGINYLLDGQYDNGGWPQFFPVTVGYHRHVTFNDNAISNVLGILEDVSKKTNGFEFVSDDLAARAGKAVEKGLKLILDRQITVDGRKTGWCAQYNFKTLACEKGRSYELASVSGGESVNIIKFLMSFDNPSAEIVDAVNSAVAFLKAEEIRNKKLVHVKDVSLEFGQDRLLIDKKGSSVWPRFINLETLEPLFSNRQGERFDDYMNVSYERREKYSWYVTDPGKIFKKGYPEWQARYSPDANALKQ